MNIKQQNSLRSNVKHETLNFKHLTFEDPASPSVSALRAYKEDLSVVAQDFVGSLMLVECYKLRFLSAASAATSVLNQIADEAVRCLKFNVSCLMFEKGGKNAV